MAGDIEVSINTSNINRLWADLLIAELVRSGVRMFCLAPGSRSTPLTTAVAAHPDAPHVMHFDERGSAFYALGFSRATGRPAAWITTSGTAVANGMPAVVEASVSGVPLILLTADRPPELRDTGANQTIDQVKFFGDYVRWQVDLPVPTMAISPEAVLTAADQAVYRSRRMPGGPVHINCMYREPLAPDDDGSYHPAYLEPVESWMAGTRPYTSYLQSHHIPHDDEIDQLAASLDGVERGLVVAGRLASKAQGDAVGRLAEQLGWPVLTDAESQLRLGKQGLERNAVPYFDLMLVSESFRSNYAPDVVLQFGNRPTSKRLCTFLSDTRPSTYAVIHEGPNRIDPYHRVTTNVEADIISFCHQLASRLERRTATDSTSETASRDANDTASASTWLSSWRSACDAAARTIEESLGGADSLSEPAAARLVSESVPEKAGFFLASSMPVRDVDSYGSHEGYGPFVASNRGASGIDGTVASAGGFARGLRAPVTMLLGDLALLHDLNSLALAAQSEHPLTIVVVNNHGGGIFSFLPIARHVDVFEPYFGTPHRYSFEQAAAMFDIPYERPSTLHGLKEALTRCAGRTALIEIVTDRDENVRLHRELEDNVARALAKWEVK